MRRIAWALVAVLVLVPVLTGCGEKTPEQVVSDLSKRSEKLKSYKSHGKMTIHTGQSPQEYEVEVWYKKPHFYRVALKNTKKDVTQILLRNDEGVFVLTPHLEKSFRFQSDWPENSGQVYLYKSLLDSIIDDSARKMVSSKESYQFEVAANYNQNQTLKTQRIWMDTDYNPQKVEVLNDEDKVMVEVLFDRFEPNASFDDNSFDKDRNMTGYAEQSVPTLAEDQKESEDGDDFDVINPDWIPEESELVDENTVNTPGGKAVIMRYKGKKSFTLTQKHPDAVEASLPVYGKPLNLGFTHGVLLEIDGKKRLSWTYEGTDFELYGDLPEKEMEKIARSVFEKDPK
ncbi:outer membrane lipoprotein-sorting protein [Paludifilum halophilum]|uniref:DUF4367 domain-containing protein n=1 Tax=Paludifilum halophilum TaxID=1642702 RepID=A0A235B3D4_9BACL|nr:outer membrane lipoprotein-sorting protein [Paludifilum halophilum]OYD06783.1 hypothetical protein CHM34_14610 [Paludifilum halophilum]